jgi:NADH:ubiquinone oxidoreductase subunit F (NADH-binding)
VLRVETEVVSGQMEFVCGIEEDPEVSLKEVLEEVPQEGVQEGVVLEEEFHGGYEVRCVRVRDLEVCEFV